MVGTGGLEKGGKHVISCTSAPRGMCVLLSARPQERVGDGCPLEWSPGTRLVGTTCRRSYVIHWSGVVWGTGGCTYSGKCTQNIKCLGSKVKD